ncbi:MAG: hypothetical protein ACJAZ2_002419 [Glaciecola sp.]|jgi:hypothetical protein
MEQIWELKSAKSNSLIVIKDDCIYTGHSKQYNFDRIQPKVTDYSFLSDLSGMPYRYIKKIENQKGNNSVKIFSGDDSEDELIIKDENIKNEIFEFIKNDLENFTYKEYLPSFFKYFKAQIFSFLIITGLFLWSVYLAIEIENGAEYRIVGGGRPGITHIVLLIANLGVFKVASSYLTLLLIIILSFVRRSKSRSVVQLLER